MLITSSSNITIKQLKKDISSNKNLMVLDNIKLIEEAISLNLKIVKFIVREDSFKLFNSLFKNFENEAIVVSENVYNGFKNTETSKGIILIIEYVTKKLEAPKGNFLVMDNVQDCGNVGTLLRTAFGSGFMDVYLLNCAKISNDKTIRSSMGQIFKLNIYETDKKEFIKFYSKINFLLIKADLNGENIYKMNVPLPCGIVVGNEGKGVSEEIKLICNKSVTIPMKNNLESFNVAVAGSVIMLNIANKQ